MTLAESRELHIAMFPWFAFGHMIPFFHLSNELAERGHKIGSENIMVQDQFQELRTPGVRAYALQASQS